jgi:peptidoglycan DL-endopeptidase CwlO
VGAHHAVTASRLRRGVVIATGTALAGWFIAYGGAASATPNPTASQVQARLDKLMSQLDRASQQYDQSLTDLNTAKARLAQINKELSQNQSKFETMRSAIAQLASAAYEQGGLNSASTLLTSNDPQTVLDQASILSHLSSDRRAQLSAYLSTAQALRTSQQTQSRTKAAIAQLEKSKSAQRSHLQHLVDQNQAELNKLTAPPPSPTGGTGGGAITGVAGVGAARVAVQYVLSKIGDPYSYGATGPGAFDCSGLVQAAWAAAGVQIPRTTYDQVAALPSVPLSSIRPGDLLFYDGDGHVAMYVGSGMIVDAPQPGENVEEIPQNESWYASNFDSAARP